MVEGLCARYQHIWPYNKPIRHNQPLYRLGFSSLPLVSSSTQWAPTVILVAISGWAPSRHGVLQQYLFWTDPRLYSVEFTTCSYRTRTQWVALKSWSLTRVTFRLWITSWMSNNWSTPLVSTPLVYCVNGKNTPIALLPDYMLSSCQGGTSSLTTGPAGQPLGRVDFSRFFT